MKIRIDAITADSELQPRAHTDYGMAKEYAADMGGGADFPPVVVFDDGATLWLAEGFHRHLAAGYAELKEIEADVRQGSRRDAIIFGLSANAAHGMRRTSADIRRAVLRAFDLHAGWSDREIAKRCAVGRTVVHELHREMDAMSGRRGQTKPARKFNRGGKTHEMATANIGKGKVDAARAKRGLKPLPPDRVDPDNPLWETRDFDKDWIGHAIFACVEAVAKLPPPDEAARALQFHQSLLLKPWQVEAVAAWFSEFLKLRQAQEPERLRIEREVYRAEEAA